MTVITPKEGEKVLFVIRKSFFNLTKQIFRFIVMVLVGLTAFILFKQPVVILVSVAIMFIALTYAFYNFLIWFYDVYIITNKRVVCVEQKGIFSKEFQEVDLEKINDVTYSIKGITATIFRFGTVRVKAEGKELELNNLADPDEVQEMIKNLSESTRTTKGKKEVTAKELLEFLEKNSKK